MPYIKNIYEVKSSITKILCCEFRQSCFFFLLSNCRAIFYESHFTRNAATSNKNHRSVLKIVIMTVAYLFFANIAYGLIIARQYREFKPLISTLSSFSEFDLLEKKNFESCKNSITYRTRLMYWNALS